MCNDSEDVLYPDILNMAVNITRMSRDYTSAANVKIREGRELEKHFGQRRPSISHFPICGD